MISLPIYSPEQPLSLPLFQEHNITVFIKRDDMIHPFISGNKWRKLKHILQEAEQKKSKTLVTFGGAWSNHLLATACAGAMAGRTTVGFVRGEKVRNPVLDMCSLYGMQLYFTDRTAYRDKYALFEKAEETYPNSLFVNEGGYSLAATQGCAELVDELEQEYDHIVCAAGTGATAAGIAKGIANRQLKTLLHVIPVLKGGGFIADEMRQLEAPMQQVQLHTDYHFGGYAKSNSELLEFTSRFIAATGIMIEPLYTAKAMYALHDFAAKNYFKPGARILFVHTGGLTGLLGALERFDY